MKKPWGHFLLGIFYIGLIVALLFTHLQQITGELARVLAMIETMLLAIPTIILLYFYTNTRDAQKNISLNKTTSTTVTITHENLSLYLDRYHLSGREVEVAWLLYKGYTNRQIAEELYISESTVKKHVSHIYEKMNVSGRNTFKETIKENL